MWKDPPFTGYNEFMTEDTFFKAIQASRKGEPVLHGAYLLHGEEEYSKHRALCQVRELTDPGMREMNVDKLIRPDGAAIRAACEALPLFDRMRVVIVEDGDKVTAEALTAYLPDVPDTTVLLVRQRGKILKTSSLYTAFKKADREIEFAPYDETKAAPFIKDRAKKFGVSITPLAAHLLYESAGPDLMMLENTLARIADSIGTGGTVTDKEVRTLVPPDTEHKIFEMLDLFLDGKRREGIRAVQEMLRDGESAMGLASYITGRLKTILTAKRLLAAGATDQAVTKAIGGNPKAAPFTIKRARKCSEEMLIRGIRAFSDVDWLQKNGTMAQEDALFLSLFEVFR